MIYFQLFSFTTSYTSNIYMTRRFALHFAFAFNMSKITWALLPEVETRGLGPQCRAGSRLSYFIYIIYRDQRIAAPSQARLCEPRSTADLRRIESSVLGFLTVTFPNFFRKEVFQPHLPVRLPCYDLAPITSFALGRSLR